MAIKTLSNNEAFLLMMSIVYQRFDFGEYLTRELKTFVHRLCDLFGEHFDSFPKQWVSRLTGLERATLDTRRFLFVSFNGIEEHSDSLADFRVEVGTSLFRDRLRLTRSGRQLYTFLPVDRRQIESEKLTMSLWTKNRSRKRSVADLVRSVCSSYKIVKTVEIKVTQIGIMSSYEEKIWSPGISFYAECSWLLEDPFAFVPRWEKLLIKKFEYIKYAHNMDIHIQLYKYAFMKHLRVKEHSVKGKHKRDVARILKPEARYILREHLFQSELTQADDAYCYSIWYKEYSGEIVDMIQVKEELMRSKRRQEQLRRELSGESKVDTRFLDKLVKVSQAKSEESAKESDMVKDQDKLRESERLAFQRLCKWSVEGTSMERHLYGETPFQDNMIGDRLLYDFDITSDSTGIWVSRSFLGYPAFTRIHTSPSFGFIGISSLVRSLAIVIYCHRNYRGFVNILTILQLVWMLYLPDFYSYLENCFLLLYTIDFFLATVCKGFIMHDYAYLRSWWNVLDFSLTVVQYLRITGWFAYFTLQLSQIKENLHNFARFAFNPIGTPFVNASAWNSAGIELGISRLVETGRAFRLARELKNIIFLQELQTIVRIIIKLFSDMVPMVLLISYVLAALGIVANQMWKDEFRQICWPNSLNVTTFMQEKASSSADEKTQAMDLGKHYPFTFHPCSTRNYPLSHHCSFEESCTYVSYQVLNAVGRGLKLNLTFDQSNTTVILLLQLFTNSETESVYYRMIDHGGIYGFTFSMIVVLFGFYMFALFLSIIYDIYDNEIRKSRAISANSVYYFEGVPEFSLADTSNLMVTPMSFIDDKRYSQETLSFGHKKFLRRTFPLPAALDQRNDVNKELEQEYLKYKLDKELNAAKSARGDSPEDGGFSISRLKRYALVFVQYDRLIEYLRRFLERRLVKLSINIMIGLQFVFVMVSGGRTLVSSQTFSQSLLAIHVVFTSFYVVEMVLKYSSYGFVYFRDSWNFFDLTVVIINVIYELDGFGSQVLIAVTHLRFFRIMRLLIETWAALKAITLTILNSLEAVFTTFVVFLLIFAYLTLVSHRLFDTIRRQEPSDVAEVSLSYATITDAGLAVFMQLFNSQWFDAVGQYIEYLETAKPEFAYREYIPNGMYIFIGVTFFFFIIFKFLLVPQIVSNVEVNQLMEETKPESRWVELRSSVTNLVSRVKQLNQRSKSESKESWSSKLFRTLVPQSIIKGDKRVTAVLSTPYWRMFIFFVIMADTVYNWFNSPSIATSSTFSYLYFLSGLFIQSIITTDLVLRFYGLGFKNFFTTTIEQKEAFKIWALLVTSIDIIAVVFSISGIILKHLFGYYFTGYQVVNVGQSLGFVRLIARSNRIQLWTKALLRHIKGLGNILILCLFILLLLSMVGVQAFRNRMWHCLVVTGGWFDEYSGVENKLLLRPNNSANGGRTAENPQSCPETDNRFEYKSTVASFAIRQHTYFYNFEDALRGLEAVLQIIFGGDLWSTAGILTSLSSLDDTSQNVEVTATYSRASWFFVAAVICVGIIVEALLFSVIMENLMDKHAFPEGSVWRSITDPNVQKMYVSLECIKNVAPWSAYELSKHPIWKTFQQIFRQKATDNLMLIVMLFNLCWLGFGLIPPGVSVDTVEYFFLLYYFMDGLTRFCTIGLPYLLFPGLTFSDLVLPLLLSSLHASGLRMGSVRWSLFITVRILAPERYIKMAFLRKAKLMVKAVVTSCTEQFYLLLGLVIFLISIANIGMGFFQFTDKMDIKYSPTSMPRVYTSLPSAFFHLTAVAFSGTYDISTTHLIVRSMFCRRQVEAVINDAVAAEYANIEQIDDPGVFLNCAVEYNENNSLTINDRGANAILYSVEEALKKNTSSFYPALMPRVNRGRAMQLFQGRLNAFRANLLKNNTELFKKQMEIIRGEQAQNLEIQILDQEVNNLTLFLSRKACEFVNNGYQYLELTRQIGLNFAESVKNSVQQSPFIEECASEAKIRIFYIVFFYFTKFIILNILQAVVLVQYSRLKMCEESNFSAEDIAEFLRRWREFVTKLKVDRNFLPIRQATFFITHMAPRRTRIPGNNEEATQHVLARYRLRLREKDMHVHLFDLLSVSLAASLKCDPHKTRFKLITHNLAPYILRIFPDYEFDDRKTITMGQFIKGYYLGKIVLNATLQRKIMEQKTPEPFTDLLPEESKQ